MTSKKNNNKLLITAFKSLLNVRSKCRQAIF